MRKLTIAVTVDDKMGIAFNKRRQSSDKNLIDDLCLMTDKKIYLSPYSAPLFEGYTDRIQIVDEPLKECPDGGVCFVEMENISEYYESISELIVYCWNKVYPSDKKLSIDLSSNRFVKASAADFSGRSHDVISRYIYKKIK